MVEDPSENILTDSGFWLKDFLHFKIFEQISTSVIEKCCLKDPVQRLSCCGIGYLIFCESKT